MSNLVNPQATKRNTTCSQNDNNVCNRYDIIIVGAGPSCMGLLYGLLSPYDCHSPSSLDNHETCAPPTPDFTIAVIERGGEEDGYLIRKSSKCGGNEEQDNEEQDNRYNQNQDANLNHDAKKWYAASHPTTSNSTRCTLYKSIPQRGLCNRILSIPTGMGVGGGTNINACLVTRPAAEDFVNWPGLWKASLPSSTGAAMECRMMKAVEQVEQVMWKNGALTLQPPIGQCGDAKEEGRVREDVSSCSSSSDGCTVSGRKDDYNATNSGDQCRSTLDSKSVDNSFTKLSSLSSSTLDWSRISRICCAAKATSLGSTNNIDNNSSRTNEQNCPTIEYQRVNYYQALLEPLLRRNQHFINNVVTFFHGVQVERILFESKKSATDTIQNDNIPKSKKHIVMDHASGVECSRVRTNPRHNDNSRMEDDQGKRFFTILANQKVILCAGAILSPALLLVSGIGGEEQLKQAGVISKNSGITEFSPDDPAMNEQESTSLSNSDHWISMNGQARGSAFNSLQWNGVGKKLRDHVVIPRAFLTLPNFWREKSRGNAGGNNSVGDSVSITGVRGWMALDVSVTRDLSTTNTNTLVATNSNGERITHDDDCLNGNTTARCLFSFVDGNAAPWIVPHGVTSPLHRHFSRDLLAKRCPHYFSCVLKYSIDAINCIMTSGSEMAQRILSLLMRFVLLKIFIQRMTSNLLICLLNPESTGEVTIRRRKKTNRVCCWTFFKERISKKEPDKSISPLVSLTSEKTMVRQYVSRLSDFDILVNPDYLNHVRDRQKVIAAWNVSDEICTHFFSKCLEILPGPMCKPWFRTRDYLILQYVTAFALPFFHWSGTCAMGESRAGDGDVDGGISTIPHNVRVENTEDDHVVDDHLRVRAIKNLYVCDASVFPTTISGPTSLTCAALGYAAASLFRKDLDNDKKVN